ncbi:Seipin-3 [Cardamine amara subsp. amara]|uniref:Seipin-3 n=1 Tax=Cardamine amara subsp. amara TaxID=228776 RepID=A0ABD1ALP5_CARAN
MESESSSNPSSYDQFLDAPDEFFYDCFSTHYDSEFLNSSPAANLQLRRLAMDSNSSSSSTKLESFEKWSSVGNNDELSLGDFGRIEKEIENPPRDGEEIDITDSGNSKIDQFREKGEDFEVIDSCMDTEKDIDVTDSGQDRVDPFTASSLNDERGEDYAEPEPTSTDWSMTGLVIRSIEFQVSLMVSFIKFPLWLIHSCLTFVLDPYRTLRRCRRYLVSLIVELCDLELKDDKAMLEVVRRLVWGLFWAVYVGIVMLALLVSAFMISSFVITHLAHEPLVIKESLNFDYTKNSPEAYVPITSCAGMSCKESIKTGKIRGLKYRTEITVSMTLPESEYNRKLGMFQIRVEFLSASGQILASSRRPCMIRFRSEPIRLVHTFLKIAPLVTGYVSEIQTLNLKLKGFVDKDVIPTACLKIMIEQRAEFGPGAGIPEIYDASMLLESKLPFFKRIIWNWRRTLFVWISMSVFTTELLLALVCFRPLIIPRTGLRTQQRDRTHSINNNSNLLSQAGSR